MFNFFKIRKGEKASSARPPRLAAALCPRHGAWGGGPAGGPWLSGGREAEPLGFGEPLTELMASL